MKFKGLLIACCFVVGAGNACAADSDGDLVDDAVDICPGFYDPGQEDTDADGLGDACDTDDADYLMYTIAGFGLTGFCGDDGPASEGRLYFPQDVAVDSSGNIFVADTYNHRIRKIDTLGDITTVAGSGNSAGFSGDGGLATAATLDRPRGIAVDAAGNLYIADTGNNRIRFVSSSTGVISTFAGGLAFYAGDGGLATLAGFDGVNDVVVDALGNVYVADANIFSSLPQPGNFHRIRQIHTDGTISTLYMEDKTLFHPVSLSFDNTGELLVSDWGAPGVSVDTHQIRKLQAGMLLPVVGSGTAGFSGDDTAASSAELNSPRAAIRDALGNLIIVDSGNNRIRKVDAAGVITTIAGPGNYDVIGNGDPAKQALVLSPSSVHSDPIGNLYVTDTNNHRLRMLEYQLTDVDGDFVAKFLDNCESTVSLDLTDTDLDGEGDVCDLDDDGDKLLDSFEMTYGFDPLDPADGKLDGDGDGIHNVQEQNNGTDPTNADTDADGLLDGFEVSFDLDPLDPSDAMLDGDGDLLNNMEEQLEGTDPTIYDTDIDGYSDGAEILIASDPLDPESPVFEADVPIPFTAVLFLFGLTSWTVIRSAAITAN